jgi:hypothetical protein
MATQRATRVKKHVTLDADVLAGIEAQALAAHVTVSEVIDGLWHARQIAETQTQSILEARVEQLIVDMADLRAKVLPVLSDIATLLNQVDGQGPRVADDPEPRPKIATYEEMYGPIPHTPQPEWTPPVAPEKPRKRWPWQG